MDHGLSRVETARLLLRVRAMRWDYFRGDLFDEYAWNILLVLYIAEAAERETTETMAVQEASVPPAVGVRWIAHLQESGLVERDIEREVVRLTDRSRAEMTGYLNETSRIIRA